MKVARTIADLRNSLTDGVGFVPTMGALHDGHLTLMSRAKKESNQAVASIFVNPLQFGPSEDFARYPRDETRDFDLARSAGVDVMFAPEAGEMLPKSQTTVHVSGVSELYEGASRPGHFDGVATIVCKLFHIVKPEMAYFGRKDLQQCAVVRSMVEDLNMDVGLTICETVREHDGLALSSRNAYLSNEDRERAPLLFKTISSVARRAGILACGTEAKAELQLLLDEGARSLKESGFELDYLDIVNERTMRPIQEIGPGACVIVAAKLGNTRLIDNVEVQTIENVRD